MMIRKRFERCWWSVIVLLAAITLLFFLSGCSRKIYVPTETVSVRTDTLRLVQTRLDSVFVHDSITLVQRGDTVFSERWHIRYRDRVHVDTVIRARVDTQFIKEAYPVEVEKRVEVAKPLRWWQKTLMWFGGICAAIGIIATAVMCWKIKH